MWPGAALSMLQAPNPPERSQIDLVTTVHSLSHPRNCWELLIFFGVSTNDSGPRPSIDARGDTKMFDAKYNSLVDNTLFRIGINCALFLVWIGVAYGSLAAK